MKLKLKHIDIKSPLKARSFKAGGYSVAAALTVIAIAVVINIFVNALPAGITQFDITSNQLFSISEQTEKILTSLESEVNIYWIVQSGQEDSKLETLLNRYESLSDKINVVKKDPDVYPAFIQQYVSSGVQNNSLIVESDGRYKYVSYGDIYEYDYSNYQINNSYDVSFAGESSLTSAIAYVVGKEHSKIYSLTGHGEAEMSSGFQSAVGKENVELTAISLLTVDAVPEDADCILIYGPQRDISEKEKGILLSYLKKGGKMILITDAPQDEEDRPNLDALMENYGVSAAEGIVIEGSQDNYAFDMPYYLLPNIEAHEITSPLQDGGYYVLLPVGQGLTVSSDLPENVSVAKLLTTSGSSFSKIAGYGLDTYEKKAGDIDGPFALAVAITETIDEENKTNIVWVSSTSLLDDQANMQVSGGNQDFFLNCVNWVCEQENSISIHAKDMSYEYLTMNSRTSSLLTMLVIGILPFGYLAIGIYIWSRRKRI